MRKFLLVFFTMLLALGAAACGDDIAKKMDIESEDDAAAKEEAPEKDQAGETAADEETGFEDLLIYMEAMGFEIGETTPQEEGVAESLGAEKGILVPVDEIEVQFYLFDPEGPGFDEEKYTEAEKDSIITIDVGGEKFPIPVILNGNFGLANHEDHFEGKEIVKAFKDF